MRRFVVLPFQVSSLSVSSKNTDLVFLEQLKARDAAAFAKLYDNYSGALYGILKQMLNQAELAQDALQESFVKIWRNIETYDTTKGTLFTWMLNIVRNHAIDVMRSKNMKQKIQSIDDSVRVVNKLNTTKIEENHVLIADLVANLKPEHREVIEMAYYKGYTQEELAEELNMPLGTVKTRARAALIELRKYFK